MRIPAIEQHAIGNRAIACNKRGVKTGSAYRAIPQYFAQPGWVEHDPQEIHHSVRSTVQAVLEQVPAARLPA